MWSMLVASCTLYTWLQFFPLCDYYLNNKTITQHPSLQMLQCMRLLTYNFHRGSSNQTAGCFFKGIAHYWQPTINMIYYSADGGSITVSLWCCKNSTKLWSTGLLWVWSSWVRKTTAVSTNSPDGSSRKGHSRVHYCACEVHLTARTHRTRGGEVTTRACCSCVSSNITTSKKWNLSESIQ